MPFYLAWIASGFLMIDRKVGRSAAVILCGGIGFIEYQTRINYGGNEEMNISNYIKYF